MKTNNTPNPNTPLINKWMKDHHIENVMQELGETFNKSNPEKWIGLVTPGLMVNIGKGTFELMRGGKTFSGDLYDWLSKVKGYSFTAPIGKPSISRLLSNRKPDPKRKTQSAKITKSKQNQIQQNDYEIIAHDYIHPITGIRSYAGSYNYEIMDEYQQRAIELVKDKWVTKYFASSSDSLYYLMRDYPHRFKQTIDFSIEKCAHCETRFNWQSSNTCAYAKEEERTLEVVSNDKGAASMETYEAIFVDADYVICAECMRGYYAPRYLALKLVRKSALKREEAQEEEQRQRGRDVWLEEERVRQREEDRAVAAWWKAEQKVRDGVAAEEIR